MAPKNKTERIRNFSLSQMTKPAGIPVSRHVMRKIKNNGNRSATLAPPNRSEKILPEAIAETTNPNVQITAVAVPHPASQPPTAREQLLQGISQPLYKIALNALRRVSCRN